MRHRSLARWRSSQFHAPQPPAPFVIQRGKAAAATVTVCSLAYRHSRTRDQILQPKLHIVELMWITPINAVPDNKSPPLHT